MFFFFLSNLQVTSKVLLIYAIHGYFTKIFLYTVTETNVIISRKNDVSLLLIGLRDFL